MRCLSLFKIKTMRFKHLFLFFLVPLFSCNNNPYDTSTPEKFVTSLGIIGQQPEDHNPLPYFYEKEYAGAILTFDEMAEEGLDAFDRFRNSVVTHFPTHVKSNEEGRIKISLDGFAGMNTRNFSYGASMVGAQMKARIPSDYEFISVTEADGDGVSELKLKIQGRETTLPIKKTDKGYRMFSSQEQLQNISKSVERIRQMNDVFLTGTQLIASKEITQKNFKEKVEELSDNYFKAVR